ncbi:MAG: sulfoacetaldehyde dehydrogenase [Rhodospirillaceae bacterium TMED8]|nr:sulfoacetaldehyde dehydrogenase [Magnetovibrio sp.]OUT49012.1 MAG: sulfoacetaldehyde dehydrogenase [Rhodospirillaceae bacterium TMED8]|tara:strand:- start:1916 stop:3352 length:1437 start_codon:yes stop_codon:yes gene_type:complete
MKVGTSQTAIDQEKNEAEIVSGLVKRARAAMDQFESADQERVDEAVTAVAWSIYEPERAKELAELAVTDTGLGNVESKIIKNQRKTFGCLRDLMRARTVGIIEEIPEKGIVKYAKPVGVVAAISPSTNPAATPVNKAMFSIKGRNAVIVAPSPAGLMTTTRTCDYMRAEIEKIGLPPDLVQVLPSPVNKELTQQLMNQSNLVVCTGSQNNVRRAYSSGTPAIGVGAGNVPVIIDSTADLDDAAEKIKISKCFDNATSCSSENSVTIVAEVYDDAIKALQAVGGYLCTSEDKQKIQNTLWVDGHLNRQVIAKDPDIFAETCNLSETAQKAKFFMVEDELEVGRNKPFSDEKLSLALTIYKVEDFSQAKQHVQNVLDYVGMGHSVGIHTKNTDHAEELAEELRVVRVLVNQAHTFANGGSFDNGLSFTLTMGAGTWAGNSISENLGFHHFINVTHLVNTIPEDKPSEEQMFGKYWKKFGK